MIKKHKILLIIVGSLLVGLVLLLVANRLITIWHDGQTRRLLTEEATHLPVPITCHEQSRGYTNDSLDTYAYWRATYNCNTTGGMAYDEIVSELKQQGFTALEDYSISGPDSRSIFYAFTYANPRFEVSYRFLSNHETITGEINQLRTDANNLPKLQKSAITGYSVNVSRRWR